MINVPKGLLAMAEHERQELEQDYGGVTDAQVGARYCDWCHGEFTPPKSAPTARFCSTPCRQDFHAGLRLWGRAAFDHGLVSAETLRKHLSQARARPTQK